MKKIFIIISLIFSLNCLAQNQVSYSNPSMFSPKLKAFLVVSGYGAAGGALLGLASMAFGQDGKAVAQGASLGLYAGMIFGAYIIFTHESYTENNQYYDQRDYDRPDFDNTKLFKEIDSDKLIGQHSLRNKTLWKLPLLNMSF